MPSGPSGALTGLLVGANSDPALPLSSVGPKLISTACEELKLRDVDNIVAVAPLAGFCEWIRRESAWDSGTFSPDESASIEAIAKGVPRPGHSVLGQGTFKAGRAGMEQLAMAYATTELRANQDSAMCMYADAGAELQGINYMHATDPDALSDCAGCTVVMQFPSL
eukprot:1631692-Rhodomonas_salina.1